MGAIRRRPKFWGPPFSWVFCSAWGGVALAYFGVVEIPGITPADRLTFTVPAPTVLSGPVPESPVMSHVLYVDAWREDETP